MESTQRLPVGARHRRLVWGGVHFWYRCSSRAPSLCPKAVLWIANPATTILAGDETGEIFGLRYRRSKSDSRLGSRMGGQRQCGAQTAQWGIVQLHSPAIQTGQVIHDRQAKP